jgi:hypothetical protein
MKHEEHPMRINTAQLHTFLDAFRAGRVAKARFPRLWK